jgi:hypothetical protein
MNAPDLTSEQLVDELAKVFGDAIWTGQLKSEIVRRLDQVDISISEAHENVAAIAEILEARTLEKEEVEERLRREQRRSEHYGGELKETRERLLAAREQVAHAAGMAAAAEEVKLTNKKLNVLLEGRDRTIARLELEADETEEKLKTEVETSGRRLALLCSLWEMFRRGERFCSCDECTKLERQIEEETGTGETNDE